MVSGQNFAALFRQTLRAVAICVVAVVICYYLVDRPVAFFVHNHTFARFAELHWLTEPPPLVQSWAPLVLVALAVRRAFGPWQRWQATLFLACVCVVVADQFRQSLGDLCGRYWPETWHDNNPSLIGTGAYGFHPFEVGDDVGSFPSGHSARIAGFFSVFWLTMPRSRWLYAVLAVPMLLSLIAMNYHFVGDVVAGTTLGALVGIWATRLNRMTTTDF